MRHSRCMSHLHFAVLVAAALIGGAAAPWETDTLPPAPTWHGRSEHLVAKPGDRWITPAEQAAFATTPSYDATNAYLRRLAAATPRVRLERFGRTAQGRDLIAVVASTDPAGRFDPAKPVLLVQAGIHAGEIDGKDAGLMLLRDIAVGGKQALIERVNLVFVPIFNADGHERSSRYNRPNQRGPSNQGWRTTAQNLNLNRDYVKLDTPEMQAMIPLIRKYDPALYLDLHVTDGTDYQYDTTFGWNGARYASSPAIGAWLDHSFGPAVTTALTKAGHIPGPLIFEKDARRPEQGLTDTYATPRFSNGYADLARTAAVLVENHALKPYRQRVLGMYVLMESTLELLARDGAALQQATAADRALRRPQVIIDWQAASAPLYTVQFKTMLHDSYVSVASGGTELRWLGRPGPTVTLPVYGEVPARRIDRPVAYWVPATEAATIERLRLHGIKVETLAAPRDVAVDMLRLGGVVVAPKVDEGHVGTAVAGVTHEAHIERFPAGSVRVPTDQPLGELAVVMLEPEGPDSLFAWGLFPTMLQRTEYIEGYAVAPIADRMLASDPKLKAQFEAKLAGDPKFAADPDARLGWFYARTPYYDARYLLYPIGRELN